MTFGGIAGSAVGHVVVECQAKQRHASADEVGDRL